MELNGALSNPRALLELPRLNNLIADLRRRALASPRAPREASLGPPPVLATVTIVLELAGVPLRVGEIHARSEQLLGRPVHRSSVKATLAEHAARPDPRFTRVRRGCYSIATRTPKE